MFQIPVFILLFFFIKPNECDKHEKQLYADLLNEEYYNPLARPVKNSNESVRVYLGLILQQLLDVDEKNEQIQTSIVLNFTWIDNLLKWKPEEYGGITELRFEVDNIWKPDILLYNSVAEEFDRTYLKAGINVKYTGQVEWKAPAIMVSSCSMKVDWFPFDEQECPLKFGSWTYSVFKIDLQIDPNDLDMSECWPNGEWTILNDTKAKLENRFYECCLTEPYPSITFVIHIRRKTLFYGFTLIIPSLLISLMTVLGFTLPTDSGEKLTLETTVLMTVCFMLGLVADQTPATSEAVPVLSTFYFSVNLVVSASVLFTVFVINFHHRTCHTNEMTPLVRNIFLNWLPWILMMNRPGHRYTYANARKAARTSMTRENSTQIFTLSTSESGVFSKSTSFQSFKDDYKRQSTDLDDKLLQCIKPLVHNPTTSEPRVQALLLLLQRVQAELKFVSNRMEDEDEELASECDWKFAAMVVDRFCLYIFTIFIFASTLGIFMSAPHIL